MDTIDGLLTVFLCYFLFIFFSFDFMKNLTPLIWQSSFPPFTWLQRFCIQHQCPPKQENVLWNKEELIHASLLSLAKDLVRAHHVAYPNPLHVYSWLIKAVKVVPAISVMARWVFEHVPVLHGCVGGCCHIMSRPHNISKGLVIFTWADGAV